MNYNCLAATLQHQRLAKFVINYYQLLLRRLLLCTICTCAYILCANNLCIPTYRIAGKFCEFGESSVIQTKTIQINSYLNNLLADDLIC